MKDLIIDCFAGGGGASVGIEMALGRPVDIAINHDPDAILMHKTNHPGTLHLTEDIFKVDLQKYVGNQHVALMWASPDCTSHSKAKGGQPRKQGLRILPWAVYKHAKAILPDVIIMENVEEIQQWGPLDEKGHPIKERAGEDYRKFISAMENIGYEFDSRELVAADYGAPTTRKRWYAVFRRDGKQIVWPNPTHNRFGIDGLKRYEQCGDYRKKPVVIDAVQWTGTNHREMFDFLTDYQCTDQYMSAEGKNFYIDHWKVPGGLVIKTLEGEHLANIGDYIIRGVHGEFYPCKPDIFRETYEKVE